MTLTAGSGTLRDAICSEDGSQVCTSYPNTVRLANDITCPAGQQECDVDTVRVVQVDPNVFYEYVRAPCVHRAFIDPADSKTVFAGGWNGFSMCADASQPVATRTCCPSGGNGMISCKYHGEKVSYSTNTDHCGGEENVCPAGTTAIAQSSQCSGQMNYNRWSPKETHFQWTAGSCEIKVKVRMDAMIALVHQPEGASRVVKYVDEPNSANMNFFHVPWPKDDFVGDELFPHIDNECGEGACEVLEGDLMCLCNVTVTNVMAFTDVPSDVNVIRETLKIGAYPPSYLTGYQAGVPILGGTVTVHHRTADTFSEDTIFELDDETDEFIGFGAEYRSPSEPIVGKVYLRNLASTIQIGDVNNEYFAPPERKPLVMRNP